eukprot:TRINITY_DN2967_c0_g1_i1.p1 TRINITY_DN2967_c0_g1~~TRINITY_DN2967_c0_g1_i1.p1  ORF type:complete len:627 (+),score=146.69 TRINITY_DN2967_c0_g1_i1:169-2049(+)
MTELLDVFFFFAKRFIYVVLFFFFSFVFYFLYKWFLCPRSKSHTIKTGLNHMIVNIVMMILSYFAFKKFKKQTLFIKNSQDILLKRFLLNSKDTEYGKKYNFKDIKTREEYQKQVPLSTYTNYKDYIQILHDSNPKDKNLLTSYPLKKLALTSGTSGSSKMLPFSSEQTKTFFLKGIAVLYKTILSHKGMTNLQKSCKIMFLPKFRKSPSGVRIGPASSGPEDSKKLLQLYSTPPEGYFIPTEKEGLYVHCLFALLDENLGMIEANFVSLIYYMFVKIEKSWEDFANDIENGEVSLSIDIPADIREKLKFKPNKKRADQIRKEFVEGNLKYIANRIWKHLNILLAVDTGSFVHYSNKLNYYVDFSKVPVYSPLYAATEGLIGINLNIRKKEYILVPQAQFFEFREVFVDEKVDDDYDDNDDDDEVEKHYNETILFIDQLEKGKYYEIIVTNFSGLYRYQIGDIIKVIKFYHNTPVIEFITRKHQLLNIRGEKTSEKQFLDAIENKSLKWNNHSLIDYTCIDYINEDDDLKKDTPHYSIYVELDSNTELSNNDNIKLDILLCKTNPIYKSFRDKDAIDTVVIHVVKTGTFKKLRSFMLKETSSPNQIKIPRVLNKQSHIDFIHSLML